MSTDQSTATHFHAGSNDPGYLPDSPADVFATWDDVQRYMIAELLVDADSVASWDEPHDCDDVPCPTHGDDCPEGKASDLTATAEELNLSNGPDWSTITAGRSYWITSCSCDDGRCELGAQQGYVKCATCGEMHFYLAEGECGTYMASLPGFTCGQEDEDEDEEPKLKAELNAWHLATMAGCSSPDTLTSPGALFLLGVARDAEELAEDQGDDLTDGIAERADSNVPIYTHELWATFVDLGAYQEDVSDLIGAETDMEKMAQVALYMIAERLLAALLDAA